MLEKPSHTSPVTLYLAELLFLFDQQADLLLSVCSSSTAHLLLLKGEVNIQHKSDIIWASVKLGDTLGMMLIWLETINGILCCFGGYTDKLYICSKPILYKWSSLIRIILCQNVSLANTSHERCRQLRYEIDHSVAKL